MLAMVARTCSSRPPPADLADTFRGLTTGFVENIRLYPVHLSLSATSSPQKGSTIIPDDSYDRLANSELAFYLRLQTALHPNKMNDE